MKVWIDQDDCIACGLCSAIYPEVFGEDDDGIAFVIEQPAEMSDELQDAIDSCSVGIIHAED